MLFSSKNESNENLMKNIEKVWRKTIVMQRVIPCDDLSKKIDTEKGVERLALKYQQKLI